MFASFVLRGVVALSLALGGVAQARSSCDAGITGAAGKKVACKTQVIAKEQKTGSADTTKLAKCETKFALSCARAQSDGDCAAQNQGCAAIEAAVDGWVDSLSGAFVQAHSSCDAGITRAAGKKVACETQVMARAQKTGSAPDTTKLARCETKFASSCARAQSKSDCTAQTQPCDAVELTADACVHDLSGPFPCVSVGGSCWFLGPFGESCDDTCANGGNLYDDATEIYAGSSGTDLHCANVLAALGQPGLVVDDPFGPGNGLGCFVNLEGYNARETSVTTSAGASGPFVARACACR
jgi:hypothetical protein